MLVIGLHHKTYWIRLEVQRVLEALFSLQMRSQLTILKVLGLVETKEIGEILYKMATVFKFKPMLTDELGT
jgi:hypothetical protein